MVAKCHVVECKEKYKLVMLVLASLDLVQHGLRLLQQNQGLLKTFLRDEIDCALIEFIDNHRYLV